MTQQKKIPPQQPSNEAKAQHLPLANEQGQALQNALNTMFQMDTHGPEKRAGEYLVACIAEEAEGLYYLRNCQLEWQEPTNENAHLEVAVRDGADGRLLPGLAVYATIIDANGKEIGTKQLPFLWHPWLFHYGLNWELPGSGEYTVRVHIDVPDFPRHDKKNGKRYTEPVDVEFQHVKIKTGQKKS